MNQKEISALHSNQRLLVEELIRRGAKVNMIHPEAELLGITYRGKKEFLLDRFSSVPSYNTVVITADKSLVKSLLDEANIKVPEGKVFRGTQIRQAIDYAKFLKFPVVLKPNWGSYGDFVQPNIPNEDKLESKIREFMFHRGQEELFLIEKHIPGKEHRVFITTQGRYAILQREPAYVVGNGKNSIEQLIKKENAKRISAKKHKKTSLCPITIDPLMLEFLRQQKLTMNRVIPKNKKIYLRTVSNLAQGGVSIDFTDTVHPSVIQIAQKVLSLFKGLPCIGIDFITHDITSAQASSKYAIIEINSNPGLAMHMQPAFGKPRNVAQYLADVMFP